MSKDSKPEQNRPYKLLHQDVCISNINLKSQSLNGFVKLQLISQRDDLKKIKLNCKQCKIFRVNINNIDCTFTYNDPTLEICQFDSKRSLDVLSSSHLSTLNNVDPDRGNGEIIIQVPQLPEITSSLIERKVLALTVEFLLEKPLGGVQFVVPEGDGTLAESGAHMFTYKYENSSRLWFPCIDSYSEPCTWKLEFTVDSSMTALSCGDLVDTVTSSDMKRKTYLYSLSIPTSAPNIGLAVGPFEVLVDSNMNEVTHYCLPHLLPLLKDTCSFLHEAFEFYEELLSTRYPYSCYRQVFVDEAYDDNQTYATMTILSTNLLHSRHIIDQTYITRRLLSQSIAEQFFGCFITMQLWSDAWLTRGISAFIASQYYKKAFGNNEYRYLLYQQMNEVIEHEQKYRGIILDPSNLNAAESIGTSYFPIKHLHTLSPLYDKVYKLKSHLVIRMLEDRIGRELLLQVFNKLLSLAINASQQKLSSNLWYNILLSTNSFSKAIFIVTGKNISTFLDQWVYHAGHAKFHGSFVFNRKRNTVELEIKQLETTSLGIKRYVGPLMVTIQELDGTFKHNLQIEENATKHDITCHSKSRRNKKKKIPLCTGEEVDMDLSAMDADSPVLWIRTDPEMQLLRQVVFQQPDYQWQYQLRYERDITAQLEAIKYLEKFPTLQTRNALTDTINNEQCFYRVRCAASLCLRKVANQMVSSWTGPPAMLNIFRKLFGSHNCLHIIRLNNFSKFQHYFIQKAIPFSMAGLRNEHGICSPEVLRFLLDLFKYNDNSKNKFSDCYYRASLIEALAETVTPSAVSTLAPTGYHITADGLSADTKLILEEITRYLNLDKILPCYKHTVTISCLKAIRHLQKMGHLPSNPAFFREYASYGVFIDIREAALEALVDIIKAETRKEELDFLIDLIETDPVPQIKLFILKQLAFNPPFTKSSQNSLNTEDLVDRLWKLINSSLYFDSKLRCAVIDLYYVMYGRGRPSCLPKPEFSVVLNLKEKKVSSTVITESNSLLKKPEDIEVDEIKNISIEKIEKEPTLITSGESFGIDKNNEEFVPFSSPIVEESPMDTTPYIQEQKNLEYSLPTQNTPFPVQITPFSTQNNSAILSTSINTIVVPMRESIDKPIETGEKSSKKERDESGHSKSHKDKKKKKKKHKHKNKHKHKHHSDRERHSHDRGGSSGGSTNPSPAKFVQT